MWDLKLFGSTQTLDSTTTVSRAWILMEVWGIQSDSLPPWHTSHLNLVQLFLRDFLDEKQHDVLIEASRRLYSLIMAGR